MDSPKPKKRSPDKGEDTAVKPKKPKAGKKGKKARRVKE
jgi:hypothetical protein